MPNAEGPTTITTASQSASDIAGCTEDCKVELTYRGVDGDFYSFSMTHNHDSQNVQVPIGTSVIEMYNALGRSLKELAGHANEPS